MLNRLFIVFILFFTTCFAFNLQESNQKKSSILEFSSFYIDKTSKLDIKDIVNKSFKKTTTNYFKLSYTKDSLWIKFKITNDTNIDQNKYLVLSNQILDEVILYTKIKDDFEETKIGRLYKKEDTFSNIVKPTFKLNLKKGETKEFYLKTYSISSANYFQLFLHDEYSFMTQESNYQQIENLFFGAMIALVIYNIFIFFFTREIPYLYYVLYITFITINHASYSGILPLILGNEYYHLDINMNLYYISLATIFALLFIKSFLELSKQKGLNLISNILIFSIIVILLLSSAENYLMDILSLFVTITTLFILYITIYSYYNNSSQIKYILIGWLINIIGILAISSKQHGVDTPFDNITYFYEITTFIEAILFSMALASRLNKTKELENSLQTNKILMDELNHRVKNNMQFIILLYRLKLTQVMTKEIDEKLYETENSIQAMSKLHESLYTSKNLEKINTKTYFIELVDKAKKSFDIKQTINVKIETTINISQSIYCGIIINELLTNAVKYAFEKDEGQIDILLTKSKNKNILEISDNGIGFDFKEKINGNSFGLFLIEALIKDELKGKVNFINNKGTKVRIEF